MRLLISILNFFLTLVLGSMIYIFVLSQFPGLKEHSESILSFLKPYIPATYMEWAEMIVSNDKLLLLGTLLLAHALISLFVDTGKSREKSASHSAFSNWGR
jgi:hypothetical protein